MLHLKKSLSNIDRLLDLIISLSVDCYFSGLGPFLPYIQRHFSNKKEKKMKNLKFLKKIKEKYEGKKIVKEK